MVDAAAMFSRGSDVAERSVASSGRAALTVRIASLGDYPRLAADAVVGPAQTPLWVRCWAANAGHDCVVAGLFEGDRPALTLALDVTRRGPFRIAGFMGGSHANGNFPAADRGLAARIGAADLSRLTAAIAKARPDIDVLSLERLAPALDGIANPLLALPHRQSPNVALATTLPASFDALVERIGAKRRRKKYRGQLRKFEAVGGFRRYRASSPAEVDGLIDTFFALKAERFRKLGVRDVFSDDGVKDFFRALFTQALDNDPPSFQLHGLEVAGKVRAVTGGCLLPDRMTCEFGAIVEDELVQASPGDFLFHENIREACELGIGLYDFSVGDEPYKRQWCDVEVRQADLLVPLSLKGRLYAAAEHAKSAGKALVKNNPRLWAIAKRLRRRSAGITAPSASESSDD